MSEALEKTLREIFFESSVKKEFRDEGEREAFYWKYLGFYLTHHPSLLVTAGEEKVLGYGVGMASTCGPEILALQPHLVTFKDFFPEYPAHLHTNCHADARGRGIGSDLVLRLERKLAAQGAAGVHIITAPGARNRSFYARLGYEFEVLRTYNGSSLLLMGKKLINL